MSMLVKKQKPILYDPLIIPRVKQYLEENVHQTYVDVTIMARQLQDQYRDYNRRKSGPFRVLVEQAYKTVLHSYGLDSNPSSDDDDGNSELEVMDDNSISNHMNNMLTNLYSKNKNQNHDTAPTTTTKDTSTANEAVVDISSDESMDEHNLNGKATKTLNIKLPKNLSTLKTAENKNKLPDTDDNQRKFGLLMKNLNKDKPTLTVTYPQNNLEQQNKKRKLCPNNLANTLVWKKVNPTATENHSNESGGSSSVRELIVNPVPKKSIHNILTRPRKYKKEVIPENAQYTFQNMGGMEKVLKELCELLFHYRNPQIYHHIGLSAPRGLLLHGPPGCGKTMLAEAIAGTLDVPFINVPATELIAGVSGESEERIREVFEQSAIYAPCVLFIDEIDAISSNRINAQKDMERRIVAQLISSLDCLDNIENGDLVLVVGATNRPETLDPALRRVGRFDHEISLGIPDRTAREEILRVICDKLILEPEFNFDKIAELTPGYVGADLFALAFRAASIAVKRKYFNQMRKRQAETDLNIPIVDLLEDNVAGSICSNKEQSNNSSKNEDDKVETNNVEGDKVEKILETIPEKVIEKNSIEESVDKNTNIEKKSNIENDEVFSLNITLDVDEDMEKETAGSTTKADISKNESNDETNCTTDDITDKEVETSNSIIVEKNSKVSVMKTTKKDPSLLELLHWLKCDTITLQEADLLDLCLTMVDFQEAIKVLQPSAKREGFITVPDVTWDDIGSLKNIREELQLAVLAPVKFPEKLNALGLSAPSGILLCGPPGCGKTLLAKAVANEAGINFISVKGPELMNMYVGESERAVRSCFQRARNSAPCVIFFDEFDSLCPKRSDTAEGGSGTRIVNQLLTEMDGIEDRKGVYLLAATNRPDIIDPAILRPGRLDTILYVGLPETTDRCEILQALTKNRTKPVLADDVDLNKIGELTDGYTGADLAGLLRQASLLALKDSITNPSIKLEDLRVTEKHFEKALSLTKSSVSKMDRKVYEDIKLKYAAPREQFN